MRRVGTYGNVNNSPVGYCRGGPAYAEWGSISGTMGFLAPACGGSNLRAWKGAMHGFILAPVSLLTLPQPATGVSSHLSATPFPPCVLAPGVARLPLIRDGSGRPPMLIRLSHCIYLCLCRVCCGGGGGPPATLLPILTQSSMLPQPMQHALLPRVMFRWWKSRGLPCPRHISKGAWHGTMLPLPTAMSQ